MEASADLRLGRAQLGFDGLPARELATVMLGEVRAALAVLELTGEIRDELLDELATELPQRRAADRTRARGSRSPARRGATRAGSIS